MGTQNAEQLLLSSWPIYILSSHMPGYSFSLPSLENQSLLIFTADTPSRWWWLTAQRLEVLWVNCTPFGDYSYLYIEETDSQVSSKGELFQEDKI